MLGDRAAAEDVTALAFERALRGRAGYRPGKGSERAWLFGIARNAALDELRRRKRVVVAARRARRPAASRARTTRRRGWIARSCAPRSPR